MVVDGTVSPVLFCLLFSKPYYDETSGVELNLKLWIHLLNLDGAYFTWRRNVRSVSSPTETHFGIGLDMYKPQFVASKLPQLYQEICFFTFPVNLALKPNVAVRLLLILVQVDHDDAFSQIKVYPQSGHSTRISTPGHSTPPWPEFADDSVSYLNKAVLIIFENGSGKNFLFLSLLHILNMSNEKLRVGIAGLGRMGKNYSWRNQKRNTLTINRQASCCELCYHVPGDCDGS